MKSIRKISLFMLAMLFIFGIHTSYAETTTLEDIANEINTCEETMKMKEDGIILTATYTETTITMKIVVGQDSYTSTYTLNENILTNSNFLIESESTFSQILLSAVNNLNGNKGIYSTIQNKLYEGVTPYAKCTLEKDGIYYDYTNKIINIDITKTMEPIKFEKTYFEANDYDNSLSSIAGCARINDCVIMFSNGMWFFWTNDDTFENLDKSIPGLMEHLDGDKNDDITPEKVMEYYNKNYSGFAEGTKSFKGFDIAVAEYSDLKSDDSDILYQGLGIIGLGIHGDSKIALVKLNGAEVREAIRAMNVENTDQQNNNTQIIVPTTNLDNTNKPATSENNNKTNNTNKKYPNAGLQFENIIYALFALIVASVIGIIVLKVKKD